MIQRALCAFTVLLLLSGCAREQSLQLDRRFLSENDLEICVNKDCPEISIGYLQATGPENSTRSINEKIEQQVAQALDIGATERPSKLASIPEAVEEFVRIYQMHLAEFPDMPAQYTADINVEKVLQTDSLISLSINQYLYTGGAHGYGQTRFLNFDPDSGKELTLESLFKDRDSFKKLAEKHFRTAYRIPPSASINSTGFWFEDERFSLPETVGFTPEEVLLLYNPYAIASYAEGPVELRIPLNEVEPYLSKRHP